MCISIVFGIDMVTEEHIKEFKIRLAKLSEEYGYGIGIGREKILSAAERKTVEILGEPDIVFEVHDLPEPHCACDIDHDIRVSSKLGKTSKFFDFVKDIIDDKFLKRASVLFFQEVLPEKDNARIHSGSYDDFVLLINRWNTWQVEGFEPNRQAYYIADETPLLYNFS